MRTALVLASSLIFSSTATLAQVSNGSGIDNENMVMDEAAIEGAIHAKAIINSISEDSFNFSRDAIPEIGWPAMTMDMPLIENVEMIENVDTGGAVIIMLVKGENGMYAVGALMSEM